MQQVQLDLRGVHHFRDGAVAGPLGNDAQAHFLEDDAGCPGIATDVVVADDGDVVGGGFEGDAVALVEHPVTDRVVGDVVAEGLRNAAEAFAAHRHDGLADGGGTLLGDRLDVVADQADRALGLDRNALVQREEQFDFVDQLGQLLVAAEDDVLLLEIGGEVHRAEGVDAGGADVVVTATGAGILAAADGAVRDVDHVLDRTPDHALGTGVGTTANGHDAGQGLAVGSDALLGLFNSLIVDRQMLGAVLLGFFRINLKHLGDEGFGFFARQSRHVFLLTPPPICGRRTG